MHSDHTITVTGLSIHPVKSCAGIEVREAPLTRRGLAWDREWALSDAEGLVVTQRQHPRLALVRTSLDARSLNLTAPGREPLALPLMLRPMREGRVRLWGLDVPGLDEGDEAAAWFSSFLGVPCRLLRFNPAARRLSKMEWTGGVEAENSYSDGYPLLLAAEESLADLNARIRGAEALPMNRFRANLVVKGGGPFDEDRWQTLESGGILLRVVKPCTRCPITTTDQATAAVGKEPLTTLATFRRDEKLGGVTFAQNVIAIRGFGCWLRVGMTFLARP